MSGLSAFLAANATPMENIKVPISDRFRDMDGSPIEWELRALPESENEALRRSCTKTVRNRHAETEKTDYNLYLGKLVVACVVFPDLNDAALQDSYGVLGADNLVKKMLTAGEYSALLEKVQEINGFDKDMTELKDEAKN
ncbi:MAG: phage portal protein [Bacillota bacterium]|nr:phage portal protein [Bacillota bacterium]